MNADRLRRSAFIVVNRESLDKARSVLPGSGAFPALAFKVPRSHRSPSCGMAGLEGLLGVGATELATLTHLRPVADDRTVVPSLPDSTGPGP